jgi:hypothetical protein
MPIIKVIETKRKPPMWSVKVGARERSPDFEIVEKPMPKRKGNAAGLSDAT